MFTRSPRLEAAKLRTSLSNGIPKPKQQQDRPQPSPLLIAPTPRSDSPASIASDAPNHRHGLSPLPSPLLSPTVLEDPKPVPASGSKTSAFFGSSWRALIPIPAPPPANSSRPPLLESTDTTPKAQEPSGVSEPVNIPSSSPSVLSEPRSQTADFFYSTNKFAPSPPPSTRNSSPEESSTSLDKERAALALARLFPERDRKQSIEELDQDALSRSSSRSSASGFSRRPPELVYWTPESSDLSRSSSRSSVSGFRRNYGMTVADGGDTSFPYISSSPPIRESPFEPPKELITPHSHTSQSTAASHGLVRRETRRNKSQQPLRPGLVIGDDVPLTLIKPVGQGAFSSVWLARDKENRLLPVGPKQKRRKSASVARRKDDHLHGLKPCLRPQSREGTGVLGELDGEGACRPGRELLVKHDSTSSSGSEDGGRVVAVKMMDRTLCETNDRTRISFVREVEVLRHISHPSIVSYLHSFTTETHHCLVLERVGGGELFDLINSDEEHARMTEPLLRRIWGELCRAVGWMHGVALVHRDIKLENILLTVNPFSQPGPIDITRLPQPLVKLTDFGLARFIDVKAPLLSTRCGSESYAAPEIITGSQYDGRQTDAWACGVVLYALATRGLPFDAKIKHGSHGHQTRRSYLVRIAKAEYFWPEEHMPLVTEGLKAVVARLLVRDRNKRSRIVDLWEEDWMRGEGAPSPPWRIAARHRGRNGTVMVGAQSSSTADEETALEEHTEDEYDKGMLVDAHDISSIASQELL